MTLLSSGKPRIVFGSTLKNGTKIVVSINLVCNPFPNVPPLLTEYKGEAVAPNYVSIFPCMILDGKIGDVPAQILRLSLATSLKFLGSDPGIALRLQNGDSDRRFVHR